MRPISSFLVVISSLHDPSWHPGMRTVQRNFRAQLYCNDLLMIFDLVISSRDVGAFDFILCCPQLAHSAVASFSGLALRGVTAGRWQVGADHTRSAWRASRGHICGGLVGGGTRPSGGGGVPDTSAVTHAKVAISVVVG